MYCHSQVVKIEVPSGDSFRNVNNSYGGGDTFGAPFTMTNRGKRSIVLNLKDEEQHAVFLRMLAKADIFLTNNRLQVRIWDIYIYISLQ